ncbi:MAG: tRNA (adenosine(37)-N6)-methyltransferase TrmM [Bacteroidetes bacterium]|nr:MAG: tRNA (adenosine(37)-N6)-methyltransferase TrmM [Bacteroidota bacterium]
MPNTWFHFKQFTIQQEHAAMKVGTDGVLLGAWASVPGPQSRVLDVGCGTGLIALMLAQRTEYVMVDALEIDPSSAKQALENFQNSPWKERVHCIQSSFQDYSSQCKSRYDLIICNPPFFSDSSKTPSKELNLARHDDSLSLEDLFRGSVSLMKNTAIISLILPFQKEVQAMDLITEHKLYCNRLTRVIPAPGKSTKRVLLECSYNPDKAIEDDLTIETEMRHVYSEKFKSLVDEFYLGQ